MVEDPEINLVYVATPWQCHVEMVLHALECGKHVACEVPLCFTVEEAWRIVNKAEEKRVHCMLLENCCYGYSEMLALNMIRHGLLGTLVHGEAAYIHQLAHYWFNGPGDNWRLKWNTAHTGNPYPTHGLGPICQYMDIGRGDQMRVLSALSTKPIGLPECANNHRDAIAKHLPNATGSAYGMEDRRALTVAEAKERTIIRTRQLARRQETYLRHQFDVRWIRVSETDDLPTLAARVEAIWGLHA